MSDKGGEWKIAGSDSEEEVSSEKSGAQWEVADGQSSDEEDDQKSVSSGEEMSIEEESDDQSQDDMPATLAKVFEKKDQKKGLTTHASLFNK